MSQASRDSAIPRTEVNVTESDRAGELAVGLPVLLLETGVTEVLGRGDRLLMRGPRDQGDEQPDFLARVEHRLDPPGEEGGALGAVRQTVGVLDRQGRSRRARTAQEHSARARPGGAKGVFSRVLFDPVMLPLEGHRRLHGPDARQTVRNSSVRLTARRRGAPVVSLFLGGMAHHDVRQTRPPIIRRGC